MMTRLLVLVMAVRGSIWSSDFMTGAGGPGGVSEPWARLVALRKGRLRAAANTKKNLVFMVSLFDQPRQGPVFLFTACSRINQPEIALSPRDSVGKDVVGADHGGGGQIGVPGGRGQVGGEF